MNSSEILNLGSSRKNGLHIIPYRRLKMIARGEEPQGLPGIMQPSKGPETRKEGLRGRGKGRARGSSGELEKARPKRCSRGNREDHRVQKARSPTLRPKGSRWPRAIG